MKQNENENETEMKIHFQQCLSITDNASVSSFFKPCKLITYVDQTIFYRKQIHSKFVIHYLLTVPKKVTGHFRLCIFCWISTKIQEELSWNFRGVQTMLFLIFFSCSFVLKIYRGPATNWKKEHHVCKHPVKPVASNALSL